MRCVAIFCGSAFRCPSSLCDSDLSLPKALVTAILLRMKALPCFLLVAGALYAEAQSDFMQESKLRSLESKVESIETDRFFEKARRAQEAQDRVDMAERARLLNLQANAELECQKREYQEQLRQHKIAREKELRQFEAETEALKQEAAQSYERARQADPRSQKVAPDGTSVLVFEENVAKNEAMAARRYPAILIADSALQLKIKEIARRLESEKSPLLYRADAILLIADIAAGELGILPQP